MLNRFIWYRLPLQAVNMAMVMTCEKCQGNLHVKNNNIIRKLRKSQKTEEPVLYCKNCKEFFTCTSKIENGLNNETVDKNQLMWDGICPSEFLRNVGFNPEGTEEEVRDKISMYFQALSRFIYYWNSHDYRHRKSCFKHDCGMCRYRIPVLPPLEFLFLYLNKNHDVFQLKYLPDIEHTFIFMSQFCPEVSDAISSNTNIQWVYDSAVGFYWSSYSTKNAAVAVAKIKTMSQHVSLYLRKTKNTNENKSPDFKRGMGVLASAVYSNTGKNPICAQMAAFYLLGGNRFIYFT